MQRTKNFLLAVALAGMFPAISQAVIIEIPVASLSQSNFDGNISPTDLINVGSASLGSFTASTAATFSTDGAHDGNAVNSSGLGYWGSAGTVTLTYGLTGSATGYNITSINTIHGWGDSAERHAAQRYDVLVTTVSNPIFTLLDSVVYDPYGGNENASTQVTLTDTAGILAAAVTGVRFIVYNDPGGNEVGVIREYDVFGVATAAVPEPASIALWSLLGLALTGFGYHRFRRKK